MTKKIDVQTISEITKKMKKAMAAIEKQFGVKIAQAGNISYDNSQFKIKYEVKIDDPEIEVEKARINFERNAMFHDLNMDGFGKTYKDGTKILKVIGFNGKARKFPIELEDQNGNKYKTSIENYSNKFPF